MASDIRPYGAREGLGFYWVKSAEQFGPGYCELVAIDEVGTVTPTGTRKDYDEAAFTRSEAALEHLADAIKEADTSLERRRAKMSEEPPEPKPEPMDLATARLYSDDDW